MDAETEKEIYTFVKEKTLMRFNPEPIPGYEVIDVTFDYSNFSKKQIAETSFKNGAEWGAYLAIGFLKSKGCTNV